MNKLYFGDDLDVLRAMPAEAAYSFSSSFLG